MIRPSKFMAPGILLFALLAVPITGPGCGRSVYDRAGPSLPPTDGARLELRLREAREAASAAMKALAHPVGSPDRANDGIDAAAWEFSRRARSVDDVAERAGPLPERVESLLASLHRADDRLAGAAQAEGPDGYGDAHDALKACIDDINAYLRGASRE